ncbi:MAG: TIGR02452 family protein [Selenomonadaceae bacterium]|nr:TIGR02452 family protein [Selenomonadaceae bacterium]
MAYVSRNEMIEIFSDTELYLKTDENLKQAIHDSIKGTKFYAAEEYPPLPKRRFKNTAISVVKRRSLDAAISMQRKYLELRIAVHNFASATNPGGGVRHGSRAQEEAICRCTTLYPVLNDKKNWQCFYNINRARGDSLHDDACIYTPEIIICKNDTDKPARLSRDKWELVDVITIAAPNLRNKKITDEELFELQERRLRHMFTVVAHHGAEIFVTGAFGCGAFQNNPEVVANAYKKILAEFDGYFKEVVFAIYCRQQEMQNFNTFKQILE